MEPCLQGSFCRIAVAVECGAAAGEMEVAGCWAGAVRATPANESRAKSLDARMDFAPVSRIRSAGRLARARHVLPVSLLTFGAPAYGLLDTPVAGLGFFCFGDPL